MKKISTADLGNIERQGGTVVRRPKKSHNQEPATKPEIRMPPGRVELVQDMNPLATQIGRLLKDMDKKRQAWRVIINRDHRGLMETVDLIPTGEDK